MIEKIKNDIISRLSKIESGEVNLDNIKLLFIDFRASLDSIDSRSTAGILYDIFDFCAHPDSRKRGDVFKECKRICKEFINAIKFGGVVDNNGISIDVISLIASILETLDIPYNKALLDKQKDKILLSVFKILGGTNLEIEDDMVDSCLVDYEKDSNILYFSFKMKPFDITRSDGLTINGSPTLRFNLIGN